MRFAHCRCSVAGAKEPDPAGRCRRQQQRQAPRQLRRRGHATGQRGVSVKRSCRVERLGRKASCTGAAPDGGAGAADVCRQARAAAGFAAQPAPRQLSDHVERGSGASQRGQPAGWCIRTVSVLYHSTHGTANSLSSGLAVHPCTYSQTSACKRLVFTSSTLWSCCNTGIPG